MFEFVAGLPPLAMFGMVAILFPYQHKLLDLPTYQNPQHVHSHKGHVCYSIFSWILFGVDHIFFLVALQNQSI